MKQDIFLLSNLSEVKLELILSLEEQEVINYIDHLIERFYPQAKSEEKLYSELQNQYRNSFNIEKLLRHYDFIENSFDVEYTNTGLIKSITNNMYTFNNTVN